MDNICNYRPVPYFVVFRKYLKHCYLKGQTRLLNAEFHRVSMALRAEGR